MPPPLRQDQSLEIELREIGSLASALNSVFTAGNMLNLCLRSS